MKTEIEQAREDIKEYRKGYGQSQLPTDCIIQLMMGHADKQFNLASVSGSADYWSERCKLAEKINSENPCDPDITEGQMQADEDMSVFEDKHGIKDYR